MPLTLDPPPPTPVEPVTEVLHGVSVTDPYRWLEDQNAPRTRKWLEEQVAHTQAYLDTVPGQERIRRRIEDLLAVEVISLVCCIGNRYFILKRKAYQEQPVITMREGESNEDITLVDPAERNCGSNISVNIIGISGDGKILAYGVREGGDDCQSIEFLDVDRKQVLPDRIPPGRHRGLAFSLDGRGFYYSHEFVEDPRPHYSAAYWHSFGTNPDEDREAFSAGSDRNIHLCVGGSPNYNYVSYYVIHYCDIPFVDLYAQDLVRGTPPRLIVEHESRSFCPVFVGDRLIALTEWQAPNRRIVSISLDSPDRNNWIEIIPESKTAIEHFSSSQNFIFVTYIQNSCTRIEIFDLAGHSRGKVPIRLHGTATLQSHVPGTESLLYRFTSFHQPPEIRRYHIESGQEEIWAESQIHFDPSSIEAEQVMYSSKDGTRIPMFLLTHKDSDRSHPLPTVLYGYGGFGTSVTPQFAAYTTFLVEHGCRFAIPNLRGGGELGQEWHLAAKRNNRQNAIDDFIAAAEWLVSKGYSAGGKIGIVGGSNGGLLVGAALTQRADLFRAVICIGPLLDMLRYHLFDCAHMWAEEYGSADNAEDFPCLQAYSPYHRVKDSVAYPAVLLISGDADTRCNPMHARKMTARLQAASISGHPILLDYKPSWGHWPAQPLSDRIDALTRRLSFLCQELGLNH